MTNYRWFFHVPKEEQTIMNELYDDGNIFSSLKYYDKPQEKHAVFGMYIPSGFYTCENIIITEWEE